MVCDNPYVVALLFGPPCNSGMPPPAIQATHVSATRRRTTSARSTQWRVTCKNTGRRCVTVRASAAVCRTSTTSVRRSCPTEWWWRPGRRTGWTERSTTSDTTTARWRQVHDCRAQMDMCPNTLTRPHPSFHRCSIYWSLAAVSPNFVTNYKNYVPC